MPQKALQPIPEGFHTITPYLVFNGNAAKAIEFYQKALGAVLVAPAATSSDGKILNAMLRVGNSIFMLSDTFADFEKVTGKASNLWIYVDDCDALFNQAVKAGCEVLMPMQDAFWGDRLGEAKDPFGHTWNFATLKWNLTPAEMNKAQDEWLKTAKR